MSASDPKGHERGAFKDLPFDRLKPHPRFAFGSGPTLVSALVFATALLIAPWFVMQPALGFGFMAARTQKPTLVRAYNASVHAVFGLGLYPGAVAWLVGAVIVLPI